MQKDVTDMTTILSILQLGVLCYLIIELYSKHADKMERMRMEIAENRRLICLIGQHIQDTEQNKSPDHD